MGVRVCGGGSGWVLEEEMAPGKSRGAPGDFDAVFSRLAVNRARDPPTSDSDLGSSLASSASVHSPSHPIPCGCGWRAWVERIVGVVE